MSVPQVATVDALTQKVFVPLHDGSLSQAQAAFGSVPWQVSSTGQACGAVAAKHPCASRVQVMTLPPLSQKAPVAVHPAGAAGQVQSPVAATQVVTP